MDLRWVSMPTASQRCNNECRSSRRPMKLCIIEARKGVHGQKTVTSGEKFSLTVHVRNFIEPGAS